MMKTSWVFRKECVFENTIFPFKWKKEFLFTVFKHNYLVNIILINVNIYGK